MDVASIGRNIKKYRKNQNMRQETLAEMAKVSANYIGMIERGDKTPSLTTFLRIANALRVTADMLLCDVLDTRSVIKDSLLSDKIRKLPEKEQQRIYAVMEALLEQAEK